MNKLKLNNKVSIITGGSRGIGAKIAEVFAKNGSKIIIIYGNDTKSALRVQNKILKLDVSCELVKLDLNKKNNYQKLIARIKKKYGKVDILVNNAGYLNQMNYLDIKYKEWYKTFDINLTSVFFLSQEISKIFRKKKKGNIINISSIGGQTGGPRAPHYAAAKCAIISLTKSFSNLLTKYNVRVNCISPGVIETEMIKQFVPKIGKKNIIKSIPLNRMGLDIEVANTALFLASDDSSYITGQVVNVNGGSYLG
jgi:3-oxoacyl-[acyl-carrier protein] reductase